MEMSGKTVVVTGAAGGIGGALVDEFLEAGAANVVACDLSGLRLDAIAEKDKRVATVPLDVTDANSVSKLAERLPETSILVNCHGLVVHQGYLEPDDVADFRKEMDVNYWGQVLMCRAFAPILLGNGGGALVNFLSPLSYITFPFCAAYCASKAACRVLTEAMRAELGPKGVLVMSVCPGAIDTGMMTNLHVPKSSPESVASAVIAGLKDGLEDVWIGEGAEAMRLTLETNPQAIQMQAAAILTLEDLNNSQG